MQRYLTTYPGESLPAGTTDTIYWDDQHYTGLKSIVGLTHMVTVRDAAQPNRIVVAQRQIFASHYLYGSLAVTLVQQAQAGSSSGDLRRVFQSIARRSPEGHSDDEWDGTPRHGSATSAPRCSAGSANN